MKYAICSLSDRTIMSDISWPLMEKYCKRHGYDFITKTVPYHDRHPSWSKLLVLKELLQTYDIVVWLDDDIILTQPDMRIEALLESFIYSDKSLAVSENNSTPFNFGMIIVKKTAEHVIDQIWNNIDEETRFGLFWEESSATKLYNSNESFKNQIYIFSPGVIQGFHPANCHKSYMWKPRTFALHVSGFADLGYRISKMEETIRELHLESRF